MSQMLGWAARPMLHRIPLMDKNVPITFIYGGRSWVDMSSGLRARTLRPESYVDVMVRTTFPSRPIDTTGHSFTSHPDVFLYYQLVYMSWCVED